VSVKALFVTAWYPTADRIYNGVFVREHAKAVRASGVDVTVLHVATGAVKGRGIWTIDEELDPALTEGIATYHLRHRGIHLAGPLRRVGTALSYPVYIWSVVRACRKLRAAGSKPDVIHAHVFSAALPAVIAGRLARIPVVVTEHYTAFPLRTLSRASRLMARYAFANAARVMPVCLFLQRGIEAYGLKARFEVVPNAVDATIFHPSAAPRASSGPKRLLFVGNLEPTEHKGFPTLLSALEMMAGRAADWRLDVVGEGPSRADYERRATASPVAAAITFRGALPKPQIADLMRASNVFVLPSKFENLPCVIIEAMASGLPVVSTRVGGIPEMMSDRDGVLVEPSNPAALAEALERVLSRPEAFDPAGIAVRAHGRYGLPTVGSQIRGVYEAVLAGA
jgi:glycosyltransferase involved in cell wall biosynthesis